MTIAVDWNVKHQFKQTNKIIFSDTIKSLFDSRFLDCRSKNYIKEMIGYSMQSTNNMAFTCSDVHGPSPLISPRFTHFATHLRASVDRPPTGAQKCLVRPILMATIFCGANF